MADLDMTVVRMRHLTGAPRFVGEATLRNFPLRPWDRQEQRMNDLLRELQRVVAAGRKEAPSPVPKHLSDAAGMFSILFGTLAEAVTAARGEASEVNPDRVDVCVPFVDRTPDLIDHLSAILEALDEYWATGGVPTLARPPEMVALADWIMSELTAQYYGAAPTPWAGPF